MPWWLQDWSVQQAGAEDEQFMLGKRVHKLRDELVDRTRGLRKSLKSIDASVKRIDNRLLDAGTSETAQDDNPTAPAQRATHQPGRSTAAQRVSQPSMPSSLPQPQQSGATFPSSAAFLSAASYSPSGDLHVGKMVARVDAVDAQVAGLREELKQLSSAIYGTYNLVREGARAAGHAAPEQQASRAVNTQAPRPGQAGAAGGAQAPRPGQAGAAGGAQAPRPATALPAPARALAARQAPRPATAGQAPTAQ